MTEEAGPHPAARPEGRRPPGPQDFTRFFRSPNRVACTATPSRGERMSSPVVDFPLSDTLKPEQATAEIAKVEWEDVIGLGVTADGAFEVINSEMTAERALWLIEWAKRWALGLDEEELE
jgi:hypothetical protein